MKDPVYYRRLYDKFIESRSKRELKNCIVEIHHITPICKGGSNDASNLIALSCREHFLAHLLLHKSDPTHVGLKKAIQAMFKGDKRQQKQRHFNSYFYTKIRESVFVKIPSKGELERLYVNEKLSYKKIGKIYKVSDMTVCKWFKIYNLKAKQPTDYQFKKPSKEELEIRLNNDSHPYEQTKKFFNISRSLLYKWMDFYKLNRVHKYHARSKCSY